MYLSEIVEINKYDEKTSIYAPKQNAVAMVTNDLLAIVHKLRDKYKDTPIDMDDPLIVKLKKNDCVNKLASLRFFTETLDEFEAQYRNYSGKLSEVYLHVTQECNLRCTYCYAQHNLGKNMMMSYATGSYILEEILSRGIKKIVITGGEPLLNKDLKQILLLTQNRPDVYTSLLTNGTLLNDNIEILEMANNITVSLDVGDSNNRKGISVNHILESLSRLPEQIKTKVTVRSVISKGEEHLIAAMREKITDMGLAYVVIPRLPGCFADIEQMPDMEFISSDGYFNDKSFRPTKCGGAVTVIAVDWNGDIYPCQNLMKPELKITSILNPNWETELNNSVVTDRLKHAHVQEIEKCKNCYVRYVCGGGCRALSYAVYGDLNHSLDFFCKHFEDNSIKNLKAITYGGNTYEV